MKFIIIFALVLSFFISPTNAKSGLQSFDKQGFYAVMASGKMEKINDELAIVTASNASEKEGYEGALLIRKAGLMKIPAEKLKYFKRGRIKLETAIMNDKDNAEYHFLRLSIEEHAPKIVKYSADIQADAAIVKKAYKNLSPVVQQAIVDYSKNSAVLNPRDL
jgi:hypothetical protein